MEAPNVGPDWFWNLLGVLLATGAITVVVGIVLGIIWLVNHVHFK